MADETRYIFDNPRTVKMVLYLLYISCGLLLLIDFVIHRHITTRWEKLLGFYCIYGFIGCSAIVIGSKWLRAVVEREEDYYTRDELPGEKPNREEAPHVEQ